MKPVPILLMTEATAGGTRRHLFDLVTGLDRNAFAPSVLCSPLRDPSFRTDIARFKELDIPVHVVPMLRDIRHPWRDLQAGRAIRRHLRDHPYRLLHTHSSKAGFLGRCVARQGFPELRVVHTPHVFPFRMKTARPLAWLFERLEKTAARWTDQFICVCEDERQDALRRQIADPGKFAVIVNGLPGRPTPSRETDTGTARAASGFGPDDIVVGSLGRLAVQKGFDTLLRAARLLTPAWPGLRILLAGEGPEQARLERLARQWGLHSILRILPPPRDPNDIHSLLDVFVLPSLWEGLPYGLLEAMADSRAIVASRTGGVPEAICDGENGRLVPPADPVALAAAIGDLVRDPARRRQLGANAARTVATRFRLDAMLARTQDIYRQCVASEQ